MFDRIAELANSSALQNFGRTFSIPEIRDYVLSLKVCVLFSGAACVSISHAGEVGLVVDPSRVRDVYRDVCRFLSDYTEPLHCSVLQTNKAVCRQLKKLGFSVVGGDDAAYVFWRPA